MTPDEGGFAWLCACGSTSQGGHASRARARRNARRHYRDDCPSTTGEAYNVLDLSDGQQRALWALARRTMIERGVRLRLAREIATRLPGSEEVRGLGCSCMCAPTPGGVVLTVLAACGVHAEVVHLLGSRPA